MNSNNVSKNSKAVTSVEVHASVLNSNKDSGEVTSTSNDDYESNFLLDVQAASLVQPVEIDFKSELNDILLRLERNIKPYVNHSVSKLNKKDFKECLHKMQLIRDNARDICKLTKNLRHKFNTSCFRCAVCKEEIKVYGNLNLFDALLQHEHIEQKFANAVQNLVQINDEEETNANPLPCCSTKLQTSNVKIIHSTNNKECCLLSNELSRFTFNFGLRYDPKVEDQLFNLKTNVDIRSIDGFEQPSFQLTTKALDLFRCLICGCETNCIATFKSLQRHAKEQLHVIKKGDFNVREAFFTYHKYWLKEEPEYQAHQLHFFPISDSEAYCMLCLLSIPYAYLENHIQSVAHKERFFKVYKQNKLRLLDLQIEVYDSSSFSSSETITSTEADEISEGDLDLSASIVVERNGKHNTSESIPLYNKKNNHTRENKLMHNEPTNSKEKVALTNHKNNSLQFMNKYKNHVIVKSILNENGTELEDLLENRLLPHLKLLAKLNDAQVKCTSCKIIMENDVEIIRDHIFTEIHQQNNKSINVDYSFYCGVCNMQIKDYCTWKVHMLGSHHKNRCTKIARNSKQLVEYECKSCKLVIFGDDLSLERHAKQFRKSAYKARKKELTLSNELKDFFQSPAKIVENGLKLTAEANNVLLHQEPVDRCCQALEATLSEVYSQCKAYPFGSRVSGLGNENSDLDIFLDVGSMYMGNIKQDARTQEKIVFTIAKVLRRKREEFDDINSIPTARTPIVQVYHKPTKMDCDLSFRHALSVENTKFLRLCIDVQPVTQLLVLLLKRWVEFCKLNEYITTYSISMMVIFHLQTMGLLLSVDELKQLKYAVICEIDGWSVLDFNSSDIMPEIRRKVIQYTDSPIPLLKKFFLYYSNFDYSSDVVCPLLGRPIKKIVFTEKMDTDFPIEMLNYVKKVSNKPEVEHFRAHSPFCIQDPFDLSHNVVKAFTAVNKLKTFCELTLKHITSF